MIQINLKLGIDKCKNMCYSGHDIKKGVNAMETSIHYQYDRQCREDTIKSIGGYGHILGSCVVDKGHKNGAEIHVLTDNALIVIVNRHTLKRVTTLIARPSQMLRYGLPIPKYVIQRAEEHKQKGLNEI